MSFTNSKLITCTVKSPNYSPRITDKIDKIVIHHMAGKMTAEQCGNVFKPSSRQASSNYGIGYDGSISLYVDESNRSWATGSPTIDQRAVTIEVSNDAYGEPWGVTDASMKALIRLVADICQRNGIKTCTYTGGTKGNNYPSYYPNIVRDGTLQMHKWYGCTGCPGTTLQTKFQYIADEVNKIINGYDKTIKQCTLLKEAYNGADKIIVVPKGEKVTFLQDDGWGWVQLKYDGYTGWTYGSNIERDCSKFHKGTALKNLAIRESAKTVGKKLTTIPKDKKFTFKSVKPNNWAWVTYNSISGWCKYSDERMEIEE